MFISVRLCMWSLKYAPQNYFLLLCWFGYVCMYKMYMWSLKATIVYNKHAKKSIHGDIGRSSSAVRDDGPASSVAFSPVGKSLRRLDNQLIVYSGLSTIDLLIQCNFKGNIIEYPCSCMAQEVSPGRCPSWVVINIIMAACGS